MRDRASLSAPVRRPPHPRPGAAARPVHCSVPRCDSMMPGQCSGFAELCSRNGPGLQAGRPASRTQDVDRQSLLAGHMWAIMSNQGPLCQIMSFQGYYTHYVTIMSNYVTIISFVLQFSDYYVRLFHDLKMNNYFDNVNSIISIMSYAIWYLLF